VVDFQFLQNKLTGKWVVSAPRRSKRTNAGKKIEPICPFCPGQEVKEEELYRVGGTDWKIRVITNKFPFAPNHEVIIHSPDHHKNFDELPLSQVELIFKTYRERFNFHARKGSVYIFNNSGTSSGASLTHPHTQLVVIPAEVKLDFAPLDLSIYKNESGIRKQESGKLKSLIHNSLFRIQKSRSKNYSEDILEKEHFLIFCPTTSEWPDETWIAPRKNGKGFGAINDREITDLSFILSRLVQIFDQRHGHEFPFNFYIVPDKNWYLRLIPRTKIIGGFELGTNIIVNTQDPGETFAFLKEHFWEPDHEKIKRDHQAEYRKSA